MLDFTFTNNIPASYNQKVDEVALDLAYDASAGSPNANSSLWVHAPNGIVINNSAQGGSNINYPNSWVGSNRYDITTGDLIPVTYISSGQSLFRFYDPYKSNPGCHTFHRICH